MQLQLPWAHRLARVNYSTRTGSFAYSFLVVVAVMAEREFSAETLALGIVTLLIYPHLAYLHARIAVDSKRAELRNLSFDSILMGVWAAQLHFALWPVCGVLVGVSMNNGACGGITRFLAGLLSFTAAALLWAIMRGVPLEPSTGPVVTLLCLVGIVGYAGGLAVFFHGQNARLMRTRNVLRTSEEQFRFIAAHAGDLVSVLTPQYRFRYASLSHDRYFESEQFADGADWLALVQPEDRANALAFLDSLSESTQNQRTRLRLMLASAPARMVKIEGNPVRDESGKLQMIVLLCSDLTLGDDLRTAGLRATLAAESVAPNGGKS